MRAMCLQEAEEHEPDQEYRLGSDARVSGEHWSGNGQEPDHELDQQEALIHAQDLLNGRVGRVFDKGREKGSGEGAYTRRVRGRI